MAFEKYTPSAGGGSRNPLAGSHFAFCWLSKTNGPRPSHLAFNAAAIEMLGESTTHVVIMWDRAERVFAIIPAFQNEPGAMKLTVDKKDTSGVRRVSAVGLSKTFPEIAGLAGQAWRILVDPELPYFVTRFASRKEMAESE